MKLTKKLSSFIWLGINYGHQCGGIAMSSLAEYFAKERYQGKWEFGDRVFGRWNKVPFIGSVGTDSIVSELEGPRVTVTLDLPLRYKDKLHTVITVKPNDIKRLKSFD